MEIMQLMKDNYCNLQGAIISRENRLFIIENYATCKNKLRASHYKVQSM
jgi:hypothetical protein